MGKISKAFALILTLAILMSCLTLLNVNPANAQTILKPSIPEFSVKIESNPYLVSQTNSTDPYTGQVTIHPSYINENKSIVVTVKNQQFVSTQLSDGNWTRLYYNLRFEGHFIQNDWTYYPVVPYSVSGSSYLEASHSEYTEVSIPTYMLPATYPNGTQIDFQVQALIGYDKSTYVPSMTPGQLIYTGSIFTGESSDWSPSDTLIFGEPLSVNPTLTSSPTVPELSGFAIVPLLLFAPLIFTMLLRRKQAAT